MKPAETVQALRKIADKIDRSKQPHASAVREELREVIENIRVGAGILEIPPKGKSYFGNYPGLVKEWGKRLNNRRFEKILHKAFFDALQSLRLGRPGKPRVEDHQKWGAREGPKFVWLGSSMTIEYSGTHPQWFEDVDSKKIKPELFRAFEKNVRGAIKAVIPSDAVGFKISPWVRPSYARGGATAAISAKVGIKYRNEDALAKNASEKQAADPGERLFFDLVDRQSWRKMRNVLDKNDLEARGLLAEIGLHFIDKVFKLSRNEAMALDQLRNFIAIGNIDPDNIRKQLTEMARLLGIMLPSDAWRGVRYS